MSTHSVPSSEVIDIDEGCWIALALSNHVLTSHQQVTPHRDASMTESRCSLMFVSPSLEDMANAPSSHMRNSSRSAEVSTHTFVENLEYINTQKVLPASHICEYHIMQPKYWKSQDVKIRRQRWPS